MNKKIIVCKWNEDILYSLKKYDSTIILILDEYDIDNLEINLKIANKVYKISDFNSIREICATAQDIKFNFNKIDMIISHTEFSQYGAGLIAEILKIENFNLELAMRTRNKHLMKHLIKKHKIRTANFFKINDCKNHDEQNLCLEKLKFPMIIKPVDGLGTINTYKVNNKTEFKNCLEEFHGQMKSYITTKQILVEEFIPGEEYHIDSVWRNKTPIFFGISKYFFPRIEANDLSKLNGSFFLARKYNESFYKKCMEIHNKINKALGIQNGPTHFEFFVHSKTKQFYFSEIGTRLAGGGINMMIKSMFGIGIGQIWIGALFNKKKIKLKNPEFKFYGWFNISPNKSGIIGKLPGNKKIKNYPFVLDYFFLIKEGDKYIYDNPSEWGILILVGAHNEADFLDKADQLHKELFIRIKN